MSTNISVLLILTPTKMNKTTVWRKGNDEEVHLGGVSEKNITLPTL